MVERRDERVRVGRDRVEREETRGWEEGGIEWRIERGSRKGGGV